MRRVFAVLVVLLLVPAGDLCADPVSFEHVEKMAEGWLAGNAEPLGANMDREISGVKAFKDGDGTVLYYVVSLQPEGFVIVSGDDLIEPIVAFSSRGSYDNAAGSPLEALVTQDLAGRIALVQQSHSKPISPEAEELMLKAETKWDAISDGSGLVFKVGDGDIDGPRVPPLVESSWGQLTVDGTACYNYYTPSNYPSGCAATAMAQLMKFYEYPTVGVGVGTFDISVDLAVQERVLRGGDGAGGAYVWNDMMLVPDGTITVAQRQSIGALCHDAGVAVETSYAAAASFITGVVMDNALKSTFSYSNAIESYNGAADIGTELDDMINPNLDSGRPVIIGLGGAAIGHAVICDGYGYDGATLYHHLNMGWDGLGDAWYDLPTTDTGIADADFTTVDGCVYNIYETGSGEIISGRVTDSAGVAVSGVTVTTVEGGDTYTATTDANGIYALDKVPSALTYTVSAAKTGYYFASKSVVIGTSASNTIVCGNEWGTDFVNEPSRAVPVPEMLQFQVGSGDGYIDVEWVYPTPLNSYDGVMVAYGLSVFPTFEAVDDGEGGEALQLNNGTQVYAGKEDTSATITLSNGTTAFFAVWVYRDAEHADPGYDSATPAKGADGITDGESFYGSSGSGGGGGGGCFLSTILSEMQDDGEANRKKIRDARIKFLELYRKAKKPKEGPGRIVGFVVDKDDYAVIEKAAIKAVLISAKKDTRKKNAKAKEEPENIEAVSGKSGVYELEGLEPGKYTVEIIVEGYEHYKKSNVYVRSGIGPGLGKWLVAVMKKKVLQKGGLLGEVKSIEPTFKHVRVLVAEAADGWEEEINNKTITLFSGTNEGVVKSIKALAVGDTVECHFVKRDEKYNLIDVAKEEEK